jgi:hypothetical protein
MRGFKNWDKALAHPYLAQFIPGTEGVCDFSKVVQVRNTTEPFLLRNPPTIVGTIIIEL